MQEGTVNTSEDVIPGTYIGVKLIKARPMTFGEFTAMDCDSPNAPGYRVTYPDGYVSWSPKEQFEKAYFPLTDPTKISEADINRFMSGVRMQKMDPCTTYTSVQTKIGFKLHETSSCVAPSNYDEKIGRDICMKRAKDRLWFAMGFVLAWAKNGLTSS